MKTEKFTKSAETFNENVSNSMKWFQDYSALILEAQSKQFKFASEVFNNVITSSFSAFSKGNFGAGFGASEKITEMIQKNIETISKLSEQNMKTAMELNAEVNASFFSKEAIQQVVDSYTRQVDVITQFNKISFETLTKQFELSKSFVNPLSENLKKEFEANFQFFNDTMKEFTGSFGHFSHPSFETGKNIFSNLTEQMGSAFNTNMKLWSDLMSQYQHSAADFKPETVFHAPKKVEHPKEHHTSKSRLQPVHS